jgi:hypothetical protein
MSFWPEMVSRVLFLLVDVNGFENGALNSGSADADAAMSALMDTVATRHSPTSLVRFIRLFPFPHEVDVIDL